MTADNHRELHRGPSPAALPVDPVCGMTVDPATARASGLHDGRTYYFCCPSCMQKFQADPQRYLRRPADSSTSDGATPAGQAVDPVCGMTVEPAKAAGVAVHEGRT